MNSKYGEEILRTLDNYIKTNLKTIKCNEVISLIEGFEKTLRDLSGNATGFPGWTEFLFFRAVYHFLGCDFERRLSGNSQVIYEFICKSKGYLIGKNIPASSDIGWKPDIVFRRGVEGSDTYNELIGVAEIKNFMARGTKEIDILSEKLEKIWSTQKDMRALLITWQNITDRDVSLFEKIESKKKEFRENGKWFDVIIVPGCSSLLYDELRKWLNTD